MPTDKTTAEQRVNRIVEHLLDVPSSTWREVADAMAEGDTDVRDRALRRAEIAAADDDGRPIDSDLPPAGSPEARDARPSADPPVEQPVSEPPSEAATMLGSPTVHSSSGGGWGTGGWGDSGAQDNFDDAPEEAAGEDDTPGAQDSISGGPVSLGPGVRLGRFELRRRLDTSGRGAMGQIWVAEQISLQREVALKVIRPDRMSREMRRRFLFEAKALARVRSHAVVPAFDAGEHVDESTGVKVPYLAMEFVTGGEPITEYCRERDLPRWRRIELFISVCLGVDAVHNADIVHRDLKPGNIMVDESGHAKVIDLGVARPYTAEMEGLSEHEMLDELGGTFAYMAPEQCGSPPAKPSRQTDVYSLGAILHELLTDRPFREIPAGLSLAERFEKVRTFQATPPKDIDPSLAGNLDAIVRRATARIRTDESELDAAERGLVRYESAKALADDLRRHLADKPVSMTAKHPVYRSRLHVRRNQGTYVTAVVAVSLVALLSALAFSQWRGQQQLAAKNAQTELARSEAELRSDQARGSALVSESVIGGLIAQYEESTSQSDDARILRQIKAALGQVADEIEGQSNTNVANAARGVEAKLRTRVARVYLAQGGDEQLREALIQLQRAVGQQTEADSPPEEQYETRRRLAEVRLLLGSPGDAINDLRVCEKLQEDPVLSEMLDRETQAVVLLDLGSALIEVGRGGEAVPRLTAAIAMFEALETTLPEDLDAIRSMIAEAQAG